MQTAAGSPPPMRGKGVKQYTADRVVGITPAYAGKSSPAAVKVIFGQDHPRLCGEKIQNWLACWQEVGSPPPMRGKAIPAQPIIILIRITPAYAGKSHSVPAFSKVLRDHPRLCGEKEMLSSGQMRSAGSPPPMRGKGISGVRFPEAKRITPAYAGKSAPLFCCGFGFWDHPRLCGEKSQNKRMGH